MVKLGVKKIITNPKLLEAKEIIEVVDSRSGKLKSFIVPAAFAKEIAKLEKELAFRKWVEEKKAKVKGSETFDEFSELGRSSVGEYLE